jgi:hypothetical protein
MIPLPGHDLYCTLELDTFLFLPSPSPPLYLYRPDPFTPYSILFPYSPAFHAWLRAAVAALRISDPAQVARNHAVLMEVKEYANLKWTAAELSNANADEFNPASVQSVDGFSAEDISRISAFADDCRPSLWIINCPSCGHDNGFYLSCPSSCAYCSKPFPRLDADGCQYPVRRIAWRRKEDYVKPVGKLDHFPHRESADGLKWE